MWVIGCCDGLPVESGAQVVLKGRNFAARAVLVELRYDYLADGAESVFLWPRLAYDMFPVGMESCGFDLPPQVRGPVSVRLVVDGRWTNTVRFTVR